ncbi:MAG: carbon monoxide dehydrogenase [Desulfobacteraceae bacterium]|nr:MAG: carbon monoxide dehydrogenase [Desulfobacteraceae bacterium]
MAYSIGFAGKGGTGKTTLAGLLVKYLIERNKSPVLAVDADANSNFNEVLGLKPKSTLGAAREEMKKVSDPGLTKDVFMAMKLEQAIVEAQGFDLLVMGRPEGPGCYCAANTLLTKYLEKLVHHYAYLVMDNEAGMEHISRLLFKDLDLLLIISDAGQRGIQAAGRILDLTRQLGLTIRKTALIINRAPEEPLTELEKRAEELGLRLVGHIPEDSQIRTWDLKGRPLIGLEKDNKALKAAQAIFDQLL